MYVCKKYRSSSFTTKSFSCRTSFLFKWSKSIFFNKSKICLKKSNWKRRKKRFFLFDQNERKMFQLTEHFLRQIHFDREKRFSFEFFLRDEPIRWSMFRFVSSFWWCPSKRSKDFLQRFKPKEQRSLLRCLEWLVEFEYRLTMERIFHLIRFSFVSFDRVNRKRILSYHRFVQLEF